MTGQFELELLGEIDGIELLDEHGHRFLAEGLDELDNQLTAAHTKS
jgi:hypothetical protein